MPTLVFLLLHLSVTAQGNGDWADLDAESVEKEMKDVMLDKQLLAAQTAIQEVLAKDGV